MNHVTYISAGAGSGKTFTLTSILADLIIKEKAAPEQFILTTFTEAAAAEFKEKAKAKIYEQQQTPRYAEYAERLDQAMIGTVDSIAYAFVQKYWYLLGVSPNLKMIDDDQKKFFIGQILSSIATQEESAFLKDFCEQFGIGYDWSENKFGLNYDFWKDDVKEIFEKAKSYNVKDLKASREKSLAFAKELSGFWTLNYDAELFRDLMEEIKSIDARQSRKSATRTADIKKYSFILSKKLTIKDLAGFRAFIDGLPQAFQNSQLRQAALDSLNHLYTNTMVGDLILKYINLIFDYVEKAQASFDEYKDKQHLIDFIDMEARFVELLDKKEVQDDIRNTYKYVFVDEFQDSSPIQVQIFDKLSEIVGSDECDDLIVTVGEGEDARDFHTHNSIWVGDFKQAIYGFRGADTDLTKAVADIIAKKQTTNPKQYKIHSLEKSYRSLEDIVSFTNDVFVPAFSDVLSKEQVELQSHRGNPDKVQSLKCWKQNGGNADAKSESLASQIAKRIKERDEPSDYAVLARGNSELDKLSEKLKALNIPVCRELAIDENRDELTLLSAFLNLVINDKDNYSRALVVFLSEEGFDAGKVVDTKLEFNKIFKEAKEKAEAAGESNPVLPTYLVNNQLIKKFMENISFYKVQTIHNLVESLIIGLDLYTVGHSWKDSAGTDEAFNVLIEASYDYEERCMQAGLPPTINGYIDFCKENAKSSGSKNGVTLTTFHGSKGLEWKKVILLGLDKDAEDDKSIFKYDVFGVQKYHETAPSETDLYPPMIINLMPTLFTGNTNVADDMAEKIKDAQRYKSICAISKSETIRLLYVAITRAKDQLILTSEGKDKALNIFKCLGCNVADNYNFEADKTIDLFNNKHPFLYEEKQLADGESLEARANLRYILNSNPETAKENRDMQPSKAPANKSVKAKELFCSGKRITIKAGAGEYDKVGTCIHDVFASLENNKTNDYVSSIVKNSGMETKIPNPEEILEAWDNLEEFLTKTYGKGKTFHEVPFKHFDNGQIYTGSIDLIWETSDGVVLVDFKSFPGTKDDVLDPGNPHYAGIYSGQFECYERALKAAGKKVLAKVIYYHVLGTGVELFYE